MQIAQRNILLQSASVLIVVANIIHVQSVAQIIRRMQGVVCLVVHCFNKEEWHQFVGLVGHNFPLDRHFVHIVVLRKLSYKRDAFALDAVHPLLRHLDSVLNVVKNYKFIKRTKI